MGLFTRNRIETTRRNSMARNDMRARLGVTRLEDRDCPAAPTIPTFEARLISGNWLITGQISDENPAGCTVAIGGDVSGSALVYDDGAFELIVPHTGTGSVTATATDEDDLDSMTSTAFVANAPGNQPPYIHLEVSYNSQKSVTLFGKVIDDGSVSGMTVTFGGKVSGTTTTASNGTFTFTQSATALGQCTAATTDSQSANSNVPKIKLVSNAPVITDLVVSLSYLNNYHLSGSVSDESPVGLTVTFDSVTEFMGRTATVDAYGNFSLWVQLSAPTFGNLVATTVDWWGLESEDRCYAF